MREQLKHYKSELKSKLDESVVECEQTKKELVVIKTSEKKAQDQIAELMRQIEEERQNLEQVEIKNQQLQLNLQKTVEENKKLDAAFLSMSSSIQGRINDAAKPNPEDSKAKRDLENTDKQIEELNRKILDLQNILDEERKNKTIQSQEYLEKINELKSKMGSAQDRQQRLEQLKSKKEEDMSIEELAELQISRDIYQIDRANKQLRADMAGREKEHEKQIRSLKADLEKYKLDISDHSSLKESPNPDAMVDKMKQSVLQKNKMIAELRAELDSLNITVDRLKDASQSDINAGAKGEFDLNDHLSSILQDMQDMPDENTKKGASVQVVNYLTRKNAKLERQLGELKTMNTTLQKANESGANSGINGSTQAQIQEMQQQLKEAQDEALNCQMKMSQQMMMVGELNDKILVYSNALKKNKIPLPKC